MTRRLPLRLCLTALLWTTVFTGATNGANRSVYTPVDRKSCTTPAALRKEFGERGLGVQECPGRGGWRLLVVASDANTWIELRSRRVTWSGEEATVYDRPIGQFSSVASSSQAEWRIDARGEPKAVIIRLAAQNPRDSRSRVSRLLVVRLERERACVIGRAATNVEARRLADGTATCRREAGPEALPPELAAADTSSVKGIMDE